MSWVEKCHLLLTLPPTPVQRKMKSMTMSNDLARQSSLYLRSAAEQPVHWQIWGEAALAAARRENKPMLLDIGAAWCHWCHVMDRESYEDAAVAEVINQHFIPIKVDRDERPDVDARYQTAVQALSGQGGWPLTVFLTPEGRVFYGGTYFPPHPMQGRPGFRQLLEQVARIYHEQGAQVRGQADRIHAALAQLEHGREAATAAPEEAYAAIVQSLQEMYDPENGGFGHAPKFPHPTAVDLWLELGAAENRPELTRNALHILRDMAAGGVYDQIGGGFHRYSVDAYWRVPHFEKMSYDNSELLRSYVLAYQLTREPGLAEVAAGILGWAAEVMIAREPGGFYASQDADISLDDDGDYFTWTRAEVQAALGDAEFEILSAYYDIGETGEMQHDRARNVLFIARDLEALGAELGLTPAAARTRLQSGKGQMLATRRRRTAPQVDHALYAGWNAQWVRAALAASQGEFLPASDGPEEIPFGFWRGFALKTLDRILSQFDPHQGVPHRVSQAGEATPAATLYGLEDQVQTGLACLDAWEITLDARYFSASQKLAELCLERWQDEAGGGFFDLPHEQDGAAPRAGALELPRKPWQDGPTAGANPAAAVWLERLYGLTHEPRYRAAARATLLAFAPQAAGAGLFAAHWAQAWRLHQAGAEQVIIVGNDEAARELYAAALSQPRLGRALLWVREALETFYIPPALAATLVNLPRREHSYALLCRGFQCLAPVETPTALLASLRI